METTRLAKSQGASNSRFMLTAFLLSILTTAVFAQVPAAFVGTWKASWKTDIKSYEAEMSIGENGGRWQTATRDKNNPCAGREVPMKLESASDTSALFTLQFSEVIVGCPNTTVTLKVGPEGTVTGSRSKFELQLSKKQ